MFTSLQSQGAKICYFSLNNEKEFVEMDKFSKKLNKYSDEKIEVLEFLTTGDSPEESFNKMLKSGVKCDGLVISGHHTGSFGGKNANGSLIVNFMEKLSCNEENKDFFNSIKALWLQGCRTLGVDKIEQYDSADFHTDRVGAVLELDHLTQSFSDLNTEFSSTLDQDNPLSSRYLRVFPRATTFGWTATAPGEKSKSEFSIPFHIANMAQLNDDRGKYFDNPVGSQISEESAFKYLQAIEDMLGKVLVGPRAGCISDQDSENSVQSWINHGNEAKGNQFAFNNPALNAYPSIFSTNDEFLKKAKELECYLKNSNSPDQISTVLDELLANEALIGYSFNSLYELIQRFKREGNIEGLVKIQDKLKNSEILQSFLMRKLASKELGIIRKIDYYAFWRDMTGNIVESVEDNIKAAYVKMVLKPLGDNDYSQRDYIQTLTKSLTVHNILDEETLTKVVDSDKANKYALGEVARVIQKSNHQIMNASELLTKISNSDKAGNITLRSAADAIGESKYPIEGASELLNKIVDSDKAKHFALNSVAKAIRYSKHPIKDASEILTKITNSDNAGEDGLAAAAAAKSALNSNRYRFKSYLRRLKTKAETFLD